MELIPAVTGILSHGLRHGGQGRSINDQPTGVLSSEGAREGVEGRPGVNMNATLVKGTSNALTYLISSSLLW